MDSVRPRDPRRAVGRPPLLRARVAVGAHLESQHVHADRPRRVGGVALQRRRPHPSRRLPPRHADGARSRSRLFRGGGGDNDPRSARAGAGASRPLADQRGHPDASRPRAEHDAYRAAGRRRRGHTPGAGATRRHPSRPPGREGARGRRCHRGRKQRRRIDGHRRADPRAEIGRREAR